MGAEAKRVLDEGLALPDEERRQVAEALLDSLADSSRHEIDPAWRDEVLRRVEGIRSGTVTPVPWSEVRRQIRGARDS
jgi:putative addiction module component (TIGR02574 family)